MRSATNRTHPAPRIRFAPTAGLKWRLTLSSGRIDLARRSSSKSRGETVRTLSFGASALPSTSPSIATAPPPEGRSCEHAAGFRGMRAALSPRRPPNQQSLVSPPPSQFGLANAGRAAKIWPARFAGLLFPTFLARRVLRTKTVAAYGPSNGRITRRPLVSMATSDPQAGRG